MAAALVSTDVDIMGSSEASDLDPQWDRSKGQVVMSDWPASQ